MLLDKSSPCVQALIECQVIGDETLCLLSVLGFNISYVSLKASNFYGAIIFAKAWVLFYCKLVSKPKTKFFFK